MGSIGHVFLLSFISRKAQDPSRAKGLVHLPSQAEIRVFGSSHTDGSVNTCQRWYILSDSTVFHSCCFIRAQKDDLRQFSNVREAQDSPGWAILFRLGCFSDEIFSKVGIGLSKL